MAPDTGAPVCPHCGWRKAADAGSVLHLAPGTILNGCYLVGRVLGQSAFAITYLGWDLQLQRKITIQEYFPQAIASRAPGSSTVAPIGAEAEADFQYGLESFKSEGRKLARFGDHPCIAAVLNLFEANNTAYSVIGYLEGTTLTQFLAASGGKLSWEVAVQIMMRVMDGLREVHAQEVLHRDISPDNIYLTREGPVKILNFSAARFEAGERSLNPSVWAREGYSPEEQYLRRGNQGPWTDVYATAATLYRSITGVTPPAALERLETDTLKSPRELGIFIPPAAEAALMRGLSLHAGDRFQSVETFQAALGIIAGPPPPPPPPPAPGYTLFDAGSVGLATFLGSPIAGTVLMAINYGRLGMGGSAAAAVIMGLFLLGLSILLGYLAPAVVSMAIPIGMYFAVKTGAEYLQGPAVKSHVSQGGRLASRWAAAGIGAGFLAAIGAVILIGVYGSSLLSGPKIVVGSKDEVYYTGSATKENAQALGDALKTAGYFTDRGVTVILWKGRNGAVVSFTVKEGIWDRPETIAAFEEIGRQIAPSAGGFPIQVRLVNASREDKKDLTVGRVGIGRQDEIYYYGTATEAEALALGQALRAENYLSDSGATVFLSKGGEGTVVTFVLKDGFWEDPAHVDGFEQLVRRIAPSVGGLPIVLHLTNSHLELQRNRTVN
jgi:hypothetical protein